MVYAIKPEAMPCWSQGMTYHLWNILRRERCCIFRLFVQVLGLSGLGAKRHHEVPPQFMTDLYNNIADESGVTRRRNPYNAKVVRSFIERGKQSICTFWWRNETLNNYKPPQTHTHTHTHKHTHTHTHTHTVAYIQSAVKFTWQSVFNVLPLELSDFCATLFTYTYAY